MRSQAPGSILLSFSLFSDAAMSDDKKEIAVRTPTEKGDGETAEDKKEEQEVVFIQDLGFTVKIVSPGVEPFDIQVRNYNYLHSLVMYKFK